MSDVGKISDTITTIGGLATKILDRLDRDVLGNDYEEDRNDIQRSFDKSDLDDQFDIAYKLLNDVGHSITPGGTLGETQRQFRHKALLAIAELKYAKAILGRIIAKQTTVNE